MPGVKCQVPLAPFVHTPLDIRAVRVATGEERVMQLGVVATAAQSPRRLRANSTQVRGHHMGLYISIRARKHSSVGQSTASELPDRDSHLLRGGVTEPTL